MHLCALLVGIIWLHGSVGNGREASRRSSCAVLVVPIRRRGDLRRSSDRRWPQGWAKAASAGKEGMIPALFIGRSNRAAVWKVAWPSVVTGLLRTSLGQVDAYMIGRLGSVELQAIGAASFAVWMVYIIGELSSIGVHALTSEAEGAGDRSAIAAAIAQGMWFSLLTSLFTAVVSSKAALATYFEIVGVREHAVVAAGVDYVRVTAAWGALPLSASACASAGFKGIGETRDALWIAAVAVALNAVLNVPFIARWGVAGAAWATNVAAALACAVSLSVLRKSHGVILRPNKPSFVAMRQIAAIGAPLASSGALFSCVYVVLGRLLASIDPLYLGALGVGHRIEAISYTINEGFAVGVCTVVGQWLGANRARNARLAADAAARLAVAVCSRCPAKVMIPVSVLTFIAAGPTSAVFTTDPAIAAAAASYLKIVSLCFPLMAIESVFEGALTGAQRTVPAFIASLLGNAIRIPMGMRLMQRYGVEGIWIAISITTAFKAVAKYVSFRFAKLGEEDDGEKEH